MFERFTERARQVVVLAQDEARAIGHDYIGTEHLLLGLLREEDGLGARTLASLEITLDDVRTKVRTIVGEGGEAGTAGQIPFTPRAKQTLELSLREGLALGHDYIGTEHILLALARQDDGVAAGILHGAGVDGERVRSEVMKQLGGIRASGSVRPVPRSWPASEDPPRPRRSLPVELLVVCWVLFALALAAGILVGWAIWGA